MPDSALGVETGRATHRVSAAHDVGGDTQGAQESLEVRGVACQHGVVGRVMRTTCASMTSMVAAVWHSVPAAAEDR